MRFPVTPLLLAVLLLSAPAGADEASDSRFSLKVALGGDYRSIYGVPIYGGDARLGLGAEIGAFRVYGAAGLTIGSTQYGLGTTIIELGGSVERRFDRLSLGLLLRSSYLRVNKVTTSGALDSIGVGVAPFVGVDLISSEGHTLFLAGSMNLDAYLIGSTAFAWGPTLSIGYRETD